MSVSKREPKKAGLQNLGNSCYLNSAVQCKIKITNTKVNCIQNNFFFFLNIALSACDLLVDFLISKKYVKDLNDQNPLSTNGEISENLEKLMNNIWNPSEKDLQSNGVDTQIISEFQKVIKINKKKY